MLSSADLKAANTYQAPAAHVSTASVVVNGRTVYAATYINGIKVSK